MAIPVDGEQKMGGFENTTRAIMTRDYVDCVKADVLLVHLDKGDIISGGSIMEMAWAYQLRIPIIAICPADCYYMRHPMLFEAISYRVDTVEQGVEIVKSILLP